MKRGVIHPGPRPLDEPSAWRGPVVVGLFMAVAFVAGLLAGTQSAWVQGVLGR